MSGIGFGDSKTKKAGKKSRKPVGAAGLNAKQRKYLLNRSKGHSKRVAALLAGYTESMADNATVRIETSKAMQAFSEQLALVVPNAPLITVLAEGLQATQTKFATTDGAITDAVECVDFKERREYAALIADLSGRAPSRQTNVRVGVGVGIRVAVEHIGGKFEPPQNSIPAKTE